MATPAVKFNLEPGKTFFLKGALYSGSVQAQDVNRHSVTVPISTSTGAFLFTQVGFHVNSEENSADLPGTYRLGAFFHTPTRADVGYTPGAVKPGDYGGLIVADQMVLREVNGAGQKGPALGLWTRVGGAPAERNMVTFYADGGFNLLAALPERNDDVLDVGIGYSKASEHASRTNQAAGGQRLNSETVIEVPSPPRSCGPGDYRRRDEYRSRHILPGHRSFTRNSWS
jgi:porin